MSGYVGGGYGRSLGVRRSGGRQPLHDPDAEGALVLHTPASLSEHEKLKVRRRNENCFRRKSDKSCQKLDEKETRREFYPDKFTDYLINLVL